MNLLDRITFNARQCGERPRARRVRMGVTDGLDLLAAGLSPAGVPQALLKLEADDIRASIDFR